jgi:phosphate transport system permease protein
VGGVGIIWAVILILFYLVWVVFPLFLSASSETRLLGKRADFAAQDTIWLSLEEQQEVALRIDAGGSARFFSTADLGDLLQQELAPTSDARLQLAAEAVQGSGLLALAFDSGEVRLLQPAYRADFDAGVEQRRMIPELQFPYGEAPLQLDAGSELLDLAITEGSNHVVVAAVSAHQLQVQMGALQTNRLSGEPTLDWSAGQRDWPFEASALVLSGDQRWVYVGAGDGQLHRFSLPGLEAAGVTRVSDAPLTALAMLLGGTSILAGDAAGGISQLFPVRDSDNQRQLTRIREFDALPAAIVRLQPEYRRRGFVAMDAGGEIGVYHSTAGQQVLSLSAPGSSAAAIGLAPRANGLLSLAADGEVQLHALHNEHPEISFDVLWSKVWYENYDEPQYVWQSSSASNDFEPKFSLSPLAFGTFKAALYAMLFAVPLALMGAAFTAYFMSPGLRGLVKPTIEIMAALPTVILGFLAGLWFAPFLEENLAGVFAVFFVAPLGLLLFAWAWTRPGSRFRNLLPDGWEPALLIPVLMLLVWLALVLAAPMEGLLFAGDMRAWMGRELGVSYDQRNALVVGVAMGFAVIPTIFSIAEDAVFGVPRTLSDGSLALGATRWQTLLRVVLPTASPGIFSGLMIGLGRAVGETMIVLMATGNTPVMDWNVFEGMRTLAANIAVEMPESEVNSSHYRILFLAALVLFAFTFVVNTGAEIIRQRLRDKYSSL